MRALLRPGAWPVPRGPAAFVPAGVVGGVLGAGVMGAVRRLVRILRAPIEALDRRDQRIRAEFAEEAERLRRQEEYYEWLLSLRIDGQRGSEW